MLIFPNEIIYNILEFASDNTLKSLKLMSKGMYVLTKDFEQKKLIKLNARNEHILYKICINNFVYPYNIDIKNTKKIEYIFIELKLKFFITSRQINSVSNLFEQFYKALLLPK